MKINLFDTNTGPDPYANMHWPCPEIEYMKPPHLEWDGISVFTDEMALSPIVDEVKSKYKIAWAFESPVIKPHLYNSADLVLDKFDEIWICNPEAVKATPDNYIQLNEKVKQCYFGACWVPEEFCEIHEKTKFISMVASKKNWAQGHRLRHVIAEKYANKIDLWGSAYKWFDNEGEARVFPFREYRYSIVIENCRYPGYFTDKIIDCFATGTIPIYWGNPKMGELFDRRGFYTWETPDELDRILNYEISEDDYEHKYPYIFENFKRFKEYASPDRWMLENCYKKLL